MKISALQAVVAGTSAPVEPDELALVRLGTHVGGLLRTHQEYLRELIDRKASREFVARELGGVLVVASRIATRYNLDLESIAIENVRKIRGWARSRGMAPLPEVPRRGVTFDVYSRRSALTDTYAQNGMDPASLSVPMLGLAGEIGTLMTAKKKAVRDEDAQFFEPGIVSEELGDILWYVAAVARHSEIDLTEVAREGAQALQQSESEKFFLENLPADIEVLDQAYSEIERFPRRLVIRVSEKREGPRPIAVLRLVEASPFAFPTGPVSVTWSDKKQGFKLGNLGAELSDNSRRADGYRFHDAIHLGFLAVLGWSPTTRALLRLKRGSNPSTDEGEDGARAIFAEEGLAAVLAKRATKHQGFLTESSVDEETVEIVSTVTEDLEVNLLPRYLWRRAISQGFQAKAKLEAAGGGYLVLDLDLRAISYSRQAPETR